MPLPTTYTLASGAVSSFFDKIRDGQAPDKFTNQILKDLGFKSNNHRAFIPILKALGFLSADGSPTQRYHDYRNHSKSKSVMGEALQDTYSDLFLITANPSLKDKDSITGKFKSFHNTNDNVAKQMTNTFFALLNLADLKGSKPRTEKSVDVTSTPKIENKKAEIKKDLSSLGLHYNIQIHLPATKDVEVYNAIFKSIKEHLIE